MSGLGLGIFCLLLGGAMTRTMNREKKEELNKEYWRTVLDIFRTDQSGNEKEAREFLDYYNSELLRYMNEETIAFWDYSTNITDHNDLLHKLASGRLSGFNSEATLLADRFDTTKFSDDTRRQFKSVGKKSLSNVEMAEMADIKSKM